MTTNTDRRASPTRTADLLSESLIEQRLRIAHASYVALRAQIEASGASPEAIALLRLLAGARRSWDELVTSDADLDRLSATVEALVLEGHVVVRPEPDGSASFALSAQGRSQLEAIHARLMRDAGRAPPRDVDAS